jgi:hypothetical protein
VLTLKIESVQELLTRLQYGSEETNIAIVFSPSESRILFNHYMDVKNTLVTYKVKTMTLLTWDLGFLLVGMAYYAGYTVGHR